MVPVGATIIPQTRGTAPGLICPVGDGGKVVYAVPGVPHEMREMIERAVLPDLRRAVGETGGHRQPRAAHVGRERERAQRAARRRHRPARRRRATRRSRSWPAGGRGSRSALTTRQADDGRGGRRARPVGGRGARPCSGRSCSASTTRRWSRWCSTCCGRGADARPGRVASPAGWSSARLTAIPGASDVFRGAIVSYASEVKFDLLGVTPGPVVSEPAAVQMAEGARRVLGADVGLALTGVAGPTEQDGIAVGTVCIAVALPERHARHDAAPRHPARADPPVRRDQLARPAPAPAGVGAGHVGSAGRLP